MPSAPTPLPTRWGRRGCWACSPASPCAASRPRTLRRGWRRWSGGWSCGSQPRRKRGRRRGGVATDPTKLYEQFQPPERLTLLIEAMARDDDAEAQRLQRPCPRIAYTARDPQFEDRWDMAFDILAVVTIDLRCMW